MADATTVVEGKVKYRDGKKWKSRWCVLKKPSPVADRLQLVLYKDVHEALRAGGKVKTSFPLDGYYGLESGFVVERESNVLAILCHKHVTLLAFDTREYLIQFEVKIRRSLGQEYQFPVRVVKVPAGSRLPLEGVKLLIHGSQLCLTAQVPPRILQSWNVADLRRFGAVDGKFCFEGGSRCGKGVGVHAVQTEQAEEISEILRVNSLGKSATTRTTSDRTSQLLDYSVATVEPLWTQDKPGGPGNGASAVGADRSHMLMCCHGLPAGGEGDEWGCRKRHSVSVTEFHRASAATFQEKLRQMSMENQERQRLMAIYDVPPKHPRKLETISDSSSTEKSTKDDVSAASSVVPTSEMSPEQQQGCQVAVGLDSNGAASHGEDSHSVTTCQNRRILVTSVAGREYCIPRSLNSSAFDSMVTTQVDTTKRKEALQTLDKQETYLHQEIVLLDQMLQHDCHTESEGDHQALGEEESESTVDSMDPWQDRISTLEPPLKCSTPNHVAQKAASLPPSISYNKDGDPVSKPITFPDTATDTPLSPHLLSKLEKIPLNSRLNAPLPYVNLASYDAETDSGFIYIQGNGDTDSGCVAVAPRLHRNPVGGSLACLRNRALIGALPNRSFSETNIGYGTLDVHSNHAPQKPLPLPPEEESEEEFCDDEEPSTKPLFLDDDALLPPTTYAPPVPYPRLTTAPITSVSSDECTSPTYLSYIPSIPGPLLAEQIPVREPIYANEPQPPLLPPRYKASTPPPELPPKGPALLQRTKQRSSGTAASISTTVPPAPPVRTRSLSVGSQGKSCGCENQPEQNSSPVQPSEKKRGPTEDYLPMGSPKTHPRRETSNSYVGSSPKQRGKNAATPNRRGNADVLSGYMDMANMFLPEPKRGLSESSKKLGRESTDTRELFISEPIADCSTDATADSNYMEMSNFPDQPKSSVLKTLEALQTYISTTSAGEATAKTGQSESPSTPRRFNTSDSSSTPNTPTKGGCKVYSRSSSSSSVDGKKGSESKAAKSTGSTGTRDKIRPAIPFTNLMNFEQKQTKSSYVNTYIPAPEVPLPEPPKKEEGFFARLMRRNSKDKSAPQTHSQENLNQQKIRSSAFERSMSEQGEVIDDKNMKKLKAGRRRSSSFPNRLSFQEATNSGGTAASALSKTDTPPPLPPSDRISSSTKTSSSSTKSTSSSITSSSNLHASAQDGISKSRQDSVSNNSSVQNMSCDSDMVSFGRYGDGNSKSEVRVLTVLHVQEDQSHNPMANICSNLSHCSSNDLLFSKCCDPSSPKHSDSSISLSDSSKTALSDSSKTVLSDSSKTDDEKLIELLQCSHQQSGLSDTDNEKTKMNLPLDSQQLTASPQAEAAAIARHVASIPPLIPPKNKRLPLSPVSEVSSPEGLSSSTSSPSSPHQHPLLPSAPNQDEAIYVDMKELLPHPPRGPASLSAASQHPYNCPREQKERARATLRINAAVEDEEGNIWVPRRDAGEVRPSVLGMYEPPPPPILGLSPKRFSSFTTQQSPRLGGEAPSNLFELRYTTPLLVSVDPIEGAGEGLADRLSISSQDSCQSLRSFDDSIIRSSPAATVLRPRSGRDYQVVERRHVNSECLSSSSTTHSPASSSVFTYEGSSHAHKSPASVSVSSWHNHDPEHSPCHAVSTEPSTPLSREKTPTTPLSAPLSKEATASPKPFARGNPPLPLPPRKKRPCHRAHSEPWSGRTDLPRLTSHSAKSSPPSTPGVTHSPLVLAPETVQPTLNYAEIDLSAAAATPPPVELTRQYSRRQKRAPPKPVAIEYTQIDHTATTALKRAGQEHAQSREDNNSLRRAVPHMSLVRKNSSPSTTKDRKGSSSFSRDRKLSVCSMDSV